jgi:hypothetical protein
MQHNCPFCILFLQFVQDGKIPIAKRDARILYSLAPADLLIGLHAGFVHASFFKTLLIRTAQHQGLRRRRQVDIGGGILLGAHLFCQIFKSRATILKARYPFCRISQYLIPKGNRKSTTGSSEIEKEYFCEFPKPTGKEYTLYPSSPKKVTSQVRGQHPVSAGFLPAYSARRVSEQNPRSSNNAKGGISPDSSRGDCKPSRIRSLGLIMPFHNGEHAVQGTLVQCNGNGPVEILRAHMQQIPACFV